MEFQYDDVEVGVPGCTGEVSAATVQKELRRSDLIGTRMDAALDLAATTPEMPFYLLLTEDGNLVGRTSEFFGSSFKVAFGLRHGRYPTMLNGLALVSVETVAGDPRVSERVGLGSTDFWLAPRVVGLAQPEWSVKEEFE
jgi:DNA helicase-2/ATP-dependent DNA helicase PcrA